MKPVNIAALLVASSLVAAGPVTAAQKAAAPGFSFADFRSTTTLKFVGDADRENRVLRLTPATENMAGAAWFAERQSVINGFETTFRFRLTEQGGAGDGADGFAFVLQNHGPEAIAGRGSARLPTGRIWAEPQ